VDGSCELGTEPSGSIKCWDVLEWFHNWRLKKGSAPRLSKVCHDRIFPSPMAGSASLNVLRLTQFLCLNPECVLFLFGETLSRVCARNGAETSPL
jgi:hypothetical protein